MASPQMEYIALSSAYLCQDCENVGNCAKQCPACASHALLALSSVLSREESSDAKVAIPPISFEVVRGTVRAA